MTAGRMFRQAVAEATGKSWEEWIGLLDGEAGGDWSEDRFRALLRERYGVPDEWSEWMAQIYGQRLGRIPTGVTKDAGVQIGVRRTVPSDPARTWTYLLSPEGRALWLGNAPAMEWRKGAEFETADGTTGRVSVFAPPQHLRITWQPRGWDRPSRVQLRCLPAGGGRTTIAFHQEMLEDVYIRELMRRRWTEALGNIEAALG